MIICLDTKAEINVLDDYIYSCSAVVHTYTYLDLQWYYYTRVKLSLRSLSVVPYNILSITLYVHPALYCGPYSSKYCIIHTCMRTVHTYVNVTI